MLKISFAVCTAILVAGLYNYAKLPDIGALRAELGDEPRQQSVVQAAFTKSAGRVTYTIELSHRYEISGLVVSKHNAAGCVAQFFCAASRQEPLSRDTQL